MIDNRDPFAIDVPTSAIMRQKEEAIGIEPIEVLNDRRRVLVAEYAPLEAFRIQYNDKRKVVLATQALLVRDELNTAGLKATDKTVEDRSRTTQVYRDWLDAATIKLARREVLKGEIEAIESIIYRGQTVGRAYSAEAGLSR